MHLGGFTMDLFWDTHWLGFAKDERSDSWPRGGKRKAVAWKMQKRGQATVEVINNHITCWKNYSKNNGTRSKKTWNRLEKRCTLCVCLYLFRRTPLHNPSSKHRCMLQQATDLVVCRSQLLLSHKSIHWVCVDTKPLLVPGTPNNQLKMDVWWNNHFLCKDWESSNWNNHL